MSFCRKRYSTCLLSTMVFKNSGSSLKYVVNLEIALNVPDKFFSNNADCNKYGAKFFKSHFTKIASSTERSYKL